MANTKKESEENKKTKKVSTQNNKNGKSNANKSSSTKKVDTNKVVSKKETEKEFIKEEIVEETAEQKDENNTTKIIIIVVALIAFFALIFFVTTKGEYSKPPIDNSTIGTEENGTDVSTESSNISEAEMEDLNEIGINEYLSLKKSDENYSVIYIGRPTCSHCMVQLPIMKHMVYKYGVTINYLNTDNLDEDGYSKLQSSDDYFSEGWGTPLILVVKNNKIENYIEGEASIEEVTNLLKKYNLINEGE